MCLLALLAGEPAHGYAAADGIGPAELLGPDIPAFARRLADEAGVPRVPAESDRLIRVVTAGAAAGAGIAWRCCRRCNRW